MVRYTLDQVKEIENRPLTGHALHGWHMATNGSQSRIAPKKYRFGAVMPYQVGMDFRLLAQVRGVNMSKIFTKLIEREVQEAKLRGEI